MKIGVSTGSRGFSWFRKIASDSVIPEEAPRPAWFRPLIGRTSPYPYLIAAAFMVRLSRRFNCNRNHGLAKGPNLFD